MTMQIYAKDTFRQDAQGREIRTDGIREIIATARFAAPAGAESPPAAPGMKLGQAIKTVKDGMVRWHARWQLPDRPGLNRVCATLDEVESFFYAQERKAGLDSG